MKAKHTKTLCKGCLHGIEHHPDRGPCRVGHSANDGGTNCGPSGEAHPAGGCRCPAFNTPASKIPDSDIAELGMLIEKAGGELTINGRALGSGRIAADELESARLEMQAALDRFCARIKKLVLQGADTPASVSGSPLQAAGSGPTAAKPRICDPEGSKPRSSSRDAGASKEVDERILDREGELGPGSLRVLAAIAACSAGATDRAIAVMTGYKPTSRKTYLADLRAHGLIESKPLGGLVRHYVKTKTDLLDGVKLERGAAILALPPGELKMFAAIASGTDGRDDRELAVLTGYKPTSRKTYLAKLIARELVEVLDDDHPFAGRRILTPEAREEIGFLSDPLPEIPTGETLLEKHKEALNEGEAFVLDAIAFNPPCTMHEIGVATGYKPTSVKTYVSKLRARELVIKLGEGSYHLAPELRG